VEHDRFDDKERVMSDQSDHADQPGPPEPDGQPEQYGRPMQDGQPGAVPMEPMGAEQPEVLGPGDLPVPMPGPDGDDREAVESPAKVMRIGSMVKQLLDEVRAAPLDERSRERLAEIYGTSVEALAGALSPDLQAELRELAPPFADGEVPSESELRVAQAQLVGWLEGLFHGIQATLFAQQLAARQQLEQMRGQLMPGQPGPPEAGRDRPGTYL
jgi:hypothetical protein